MNIHLFCIVRIRDEHKEQAIKDGAIDMIVKEGFDGLSMGKLAKAAGVSPATIYIYFKDRVDLINKISMETGSKMTKAMLEGFDPNMSFEEGLRAQWKNRAKFCIENPQLMNFLDQIRYSPFHKPVYQIDNAFITAMKTFVHNAIERKELIPLPIAIYWSIAYAPLYQLVKFHLSPGSMPGTDKFIFDDASMEEAFQLILKALKP